MYKHLSLYLCFALFLAPVPSVSSAKSSQNKSTISSFTFNPDAYYKLSNKQQKIYLKSIRDLALRITSGSGRSANVFPKWLIDQFIPELNAEGPLYPSNGHAIPGGMGNLVVRAEYFRALDLGPLKPSCPAGETPCASFLGLVPGNPNSTVACANNSTKTCARRGNIALLHSEVEKCGNSRARSSSYCQALTSDMERGTHHLSQMCDSNNNFKNWCQQTREIHNKAHINFPSIDGGDCGELQQQLILSQNKSDRVLPKNRNNSYWQQTTAFAMRACNRSLEGVQNIIGVCDASVDTATPNVSKIQTYLRPNERTPDHLTEGWQKCWESKSIKIESQESKRLKELNKSSASREEIEKTKTIFAKERERLSLSMKKSAECSFLNSVSDKSKSVRPAGFINIKSYANSIDTLTPAEQANFIAATGVSPNKFKSMFCDSGTAANFKSHYPLPEPRWPNALVSDEMKQQAQIARSRMMACLQNRRENTGKKGANCRLDLLNSPMALRTASETTPILARSRSNNKCLLITNCNNCNPTINKNGQDTRFFDAESTSTGGRAVKISLNAKTGGGGSKVIDIATENAFVSDYQIWDYKCSGEKVRAAPKFREIEEPDSTRVTQ